MTYDWSDIQSIIAENGRRLDEIRKPYDPLVGTYVHLNIPRNRLELPDAPIIVQNIPAEMEAEPIVQALRLGGSLERAAKGMFGKFISQDDIVSVWQCFVRARLQYDFEFWCVMKWHIYDKETAELVPFILNRPQRTVLVPELEDMRKKGISINFDLLKARQWGGSTCVDAYQSWIQDEWRKNWNSCIVADIEDQAKTVLGMMDTAFMNMDTALTGEEKPILKPFQKSTSTRVISTNGATVSIASAQRPEKIRSQNLKMAHLTEVGLWKATQGKRPEDLIQSIFASINPAPYTMKGLESTAKGVGNFWHKHCMAARKGKNGFRLIFVAWFQIDLYQKPVYDYTEFIESMTEDEKYLFSLGATLEAICWYREKDKEFEGEHWRMCSEFPSTVDEAFQSTGSLYFRKEDIDSQRKNIEAPAIIGEIIGNDMKGKAALEGLHIEKREHGFLKIWRDVGVQLKMRNRYLVTVDLGKGHSANADNSVICVFDRYRQLEADGIPEVVAEWVGHLDPDLIAWKAAQIAAYYNNALLVIESNTLETSTIQYFRTVLTEIKDFYRNLYKRTPNNKTDDSGDSERYGWSTNGNSKPQICAMLKTCLREGLYIERCQEALDEMAVFEEKADGKLGAVDGHHDDRVITRCIGLYFIYKDPPLIGAVAYIEERKQETLNINNFNEFTL